MAELEMSVVFRGTREDLPENLQSSPLVVEALKDAGWLARTVGGSLARETLKERVTVFFNQGRQGNEVTEIIVASNSL